MIYVTGDTHGNFKWLVEFCKQSPHLTRDDVMIILGDAGFNYFGDVRDIGTKKDKTRFMTRVLSF